MSNIQFIQSLEAESPMLQRRSRVFRGEVASRREVCSAVDRPPSRAGTVEEDERQARRIMMVQSPSDAVSGICTNRKL